MTSNRRCKNILVVEDDLSIRSVLVDLLEMEGYPVFTASNGKEALALLDEQDLHPCLILLDLMMPVMNGFQFLEVMRQNQQDKLAVIPVVILSAAGQEVVTKLNPDGLAGFIKKPFDINSLLSTVREHCGEP